MQMWRLKVQVRGDGTAEVTGMSDDVPPCEVEVRGHDDGNRVTLIARQRDPQGRFVAAAYHRRDRAEELEAAVAGDPMRPLP